MSGTVCLGHACTSSSGVERMHGLGGKELISTSPSREMSTNFIGLLEQCLGRGIWEDPVTSELARPLDAILAYLPPEGAQVGFHYTARWLC